MHTLTSINRKDVLILCVILILAGGMRLGRGDIVEYFHDDAMLATLALEMTDEEHFPLTGILSSTGIPNPPTSVYVMAIPFSLSSNPNVAIHFVMLLNVIGVGILWLIAHRYFGQTVGIITGLLYAINPWAVLFSRKIWAQDFHTPFILLGILLLLYGFWESHQNNRLRHRTAQAFSTPILIFAFQIHFASWAIAPIILLSYWIGRKRISWISLAITVVLSTGIIAPYIIGLTQTLEQDPTRISDAAGRSSASEGITLTLESIHDSILLASGTGLETWIAPDQQNDLSSTYPPLSQLGLLLTCMIPLGLFVLWRENRQVLALIIIWAFLAQIVLIPSWTPIYIHYFIPAIPAMLLLSAIGVNEILKRVMHYQVITISIWAILFAILGLQGVTWNRVLDYVDTQHIPYPGFTTPISKLNIIREQISDAEDVLVISQGMSWNLHHEVAVWDTLLWDDVPCVRTMVGEGYAVFPAHPFKVLIAPDAPKNPVNNLYQTDQLTHFDTRTGDNSYTLYQWDSAPTWSDVVIQPIDTVLFDNDVQLIGYKLQNDYVYLEWRLPEQNKKANYQYSAQLFDTDGNRISQLDTTFWHGRHWCENDRLITWGVLPVNSDATTLKVGLYRLGTGKDQGQFFNANILDELGNPIGQNIDIPLN